MFGMWYVCLLPWVPPGGLCRETEEETFHETPVNYLCQVHMDQSLIQKKSRCCERPAGSSWLVVIKLIIFTLSFAAAGKCVVGHIDLWPREGSTTCFTNHLPHKPSGFSHAAASPPALITATATLSFPLWPAGFSQKISWRVINGSDLHLRRVTPADVRGSFV